MRQVQASLTLLLVLTPAVRGAQYYVAPTGDDANPGTKERPFGKIQRAADVLQPGDTCIIRAGTYRETVRPANSGEPGRPVRFVASEGEQVTVSGADVLETDWSVHEGQVLKAPTDRRFIQLFADGRMMLEARWPNSPLDDLMVMNRAEAGDGTGYEVLADSNLPPGDWNGALVLIWPGSRWTNSTRRVVDYAPATSFRFDRDFRPKQPDKWHGFDPHEPKARNPYVLFGCLAALDSPGEWYLDEERGVVYLWPLGGGSPAQGTVEVKQRDYAFDLSGLSHVELSGLRVFAAALNMTDARHCLVESCHLRYVDHFRELDSYAAQLPRNVVTGSDNEWRRCSIAYSAGSGLRLAGERNRLLNSIVYDVNYLGTYQGGLDLCRSVEAVVSRCTVCRAGRDILQHHGSKRIRIEYNDLYRANMLNNDSGAIYSWGTDGEGGVIAYNWTHDNTGDATVGIYLDNFCRHFLVHHNVSWNNSGAGITLNSDSTDNLVCNNTLTGNGSVFATFTYSGQVPTQKGTRVINNLAVGRMRVDDPGTFVQGELAPEISHNGAHAMARNGVPTPRSGAVDAGIVVPGITDGYKGKAPDLGAYEVGGEYWVPGPDWRDPDMPAAPPMDLSFQPRGPVDEQHMITEGLQLWLDASDTKTVETDPDGGVLAWRDKSWQGHDATPRDRRELLSLGPDGMNGKPVVRGTGSGSLLVGTIRATEGPFTVFIVSQAPTAGGPSWQRLAGAWCGEGDDWVAPNWIILRPGGAEPSAYGARLFTQTRQAGHVLDSVVLFGPPGSASQFLTADIGEVLLFDRALPFDEADAIEAYLTRKWGLE